MLGPDKFQRSKALGIMIAQECAFRVANIPRKIKPVRSNGRIASLVACSNGGTKERAWRSFGDIRRPRNVEK
jgi:hypothetical protein